MKEIWEELVIMFNIKDLIVFIILFGANLLQAITGFAGTLISMPPTIKLIGVGEAKALLNAIAQISSLMIVCTGFKYINWKEFAKMFICMIIGMAAGIKIFEIFPLHQLLILYGIMIIAIAIKKLLFSHTSKAASQNDMLAEHDNSNSINSPKKASLPQWFMLIILLAAGIIHGMFVSGGALLVVYAAAVLKDKEEFRATIAMIWLTTGCYMTGTQIMLGNFNTHVIMLLIVGVVPVFVGTFIGTKLVKKIPQDVFMKLTYVLLLLSGAMAIV